MTRYLLTAVAAVSVLAGRGAMSPSLLWDAGPPPSAARTPLPQPGLQDSLPQGIEGMVYRAGGNHMPDPHHPPGPPVGVFSTVYIFELTNISQVIRQGSSPYYTSIGTRFVKKADTDARGHFRVGLPPGTYSPFTRKGELFYASRMDDKNNIAPVKVLQGKMAPVECRVESDHKAVY